MRVLNFSFHRLGVDHLAILERAGFRIDGQQFAMLDPLLPMISEDSAPPMVRRAVSDVVEAHVPCKTDVVILGGTPDVVAYVLIACAPAGCRIFAPIGRTGPTGFRLRALREVVLGPNPAAGVLLRL